MIRKDGRFLQNPVGEPIAVPDVPRSDVGQPSAVAAAMAARDVPISAALVHTESIEARNHRISMAVLVGLMGVLLLYLSTQAQGQAGFALSDAFAAVKLPTVTLPGAPTVLVCAAICLAVAAALWLGRVQGRTRMLISLLAGLAVVLGFLTWAAAGSSLTFPVANQFNGTMAYATPLILGALAGVVGERSGVVNVAIEGQFLVAAFAAALVGTLTNSLVAAVVAGMLMGALLAALLALFSIKYLVDQVVLGVVLNLLAAGLTGYLYAQFVSMDAATYNNAPVMRQINVPLLQDIPFFGPILFQQTLLVYLALAAITLVWFLLTRTKWGLRVRAVGEHPMAAATVGINVRAVRWQALLVGGLLAGLGGTYFTIGSTGQFVKDISAGNGFIALAALIMGRWRPGLAALMAIFFGFVSQLAAQLQMLGTGLNTQFLLILPYVATIIAVAGLVGRVQAPAADGKNYVT